MPGEIPRASATVAMTANISFLFDNIWSSYPSVVAIPPPPDDSPPSRVAANRCRHRRRFTPNTMTRDAFRSPLTGAPRRAAKRWRSKNSRWMHLGAQEVMTRQILQQFWAQHSVLATNSYFLVGYALALWQSFVGPIPVAMQQMTDHLLTFWSGICPAE